MVLYRRPRPIPEGSSTIECLMPVYFPDDNIVFSEINKSSEWRISTKWLPLCFVDNSAIPASIYTYSIVKSHQE